MRSSKRSPPMPEPDRSATARFSSQPWTRSSVYGPAKPTTTHSEHKTMDRGEDIMNMMTMKWLSRSFVAAAAALLIMGGTAHAHAGSPPDAPVVIAPAAPAPDAAPAPAAPADAPAPGAPAPS